MLYLLFMAVSYIRFRWHKSLNAAKMNVNAPSQDWKSASVNAYCARAYFFLEKKRLDLAISDLEKALSLDPEHTESRKLVQHVRSLVARDEKGDGAGGEVKESFVAIEQVSPALESGGEKPGEAPPPLQVPQSIPREDLETILAPRAEVDVDLIKEPPMPVSVRNDSQKRFEQESSQPEGSPFTIIEDFEKEPKEERPPLFASLPKTESLSFPVEGKIDIDIDLSSVVAGSDIGHDSDMNRMSKDAPALAYEPAPGKSGDQGLAETEKSSESHRIVFVRQEEIDVDLSCEPVESIVHTQSGEESSYFEPLPSYEIESVEELPAVEVELIEMESDKGGEQAKIDVDFSKKIPASETSKAAEDYCQQGQSFHGAGEPDKAVLCYTKALEINPNHINAYLNRGIINSQRGHNDEAITDFCKVILLDPRQADAYFHRGIILSRKGRNDLTIADLGMAVKIKPDFAAAYLTRGIGCSKLGRHNDAIADYSKAIVLNPSHLPLYCNRGISYAHKGEYEKAILDYNRVLVIDARNIRVLFHRGIVYMRLGHHKKAYSDLTKVIELTPNYSRAYFQRGNASFDGNNFDAAIKDFEKAIELNPKDAEVYNKLGEAHVNKNLIKSAIDDFTRAIELNHQYSVAYNNRGRAYALRGKLDSAMADFDRAISSDPRNAVAYFNRAMGWKSLDNKEKAGNDFKTAGDLGHKEACQEYKKLSDPEQDPA